ncbi:DBH-like monooxygenase protein 1 homolog [Centruroides vittatus]|uniref:DBH-like monooxygenase protein 1 homolog n=1 Tax=Centruroides vittatus TaxID=120091 RepID=UPI0035101550
MLWSVYHVLCVVFLVVVDGNGWINRLRLDNNGNYHLVWFLSEDSITFQVEVATKGWVGFGISPNGGMANSDIVIGWVKDNRAEFHDYHAVGNTKPIIDKKQDWNLLRFYENGTHTMLRFRRKLDTCDDKDLPIPEQTARIIYAYHEQDPDSVDEIMYHGSRNRGTKSILLLKPQRSDDIKLPDDVLSWDILTPNATIPGDVDTMYFCSVHKVPPLDTKHHIIRTQPIIQHGNEPYVHHLILNLCTVVVDSEMDKLLNQYYPCYENSWIRQFQNCNIIVSAWAVGGQGNLFPDHVGVPLYGNAYYVLEIHYDNPSFTKGIVDNSGLRLYYTPKLRTYDAGILSVGSIWYPCVLIPPKQKNFIVAGHGDPKCYGSSIPPEGIYVLSVFLHSHLLGTHLTLRHFRNGKELKPIAEDKYYDFKYQDGTVLSKEVKILPSDHLTVECVYDSTDRVSNTLGGLGTQQEMCLAFILYYPRIAVAASLSGPSCNLALGLAGVSIVAP